jgi:MFS family permease
VTTIGSRGSATAFAGGAGMSTGGALAVLFVALKLCHVISWSWLWVLAPFWIPAALVALVVTVFSVLYLISLVVERREAAARVRARAGGAGRGEHGPARRWPR